MKWVKEVGIDLVVTVIIAIYVFGGAEWARWVILVYTPLMLLLKMVAVAAGSLLQIAKPKGPPVPDLVFHILYGANVMLLAFGRWWIMAGLWALIWILSIIAERRKVIPVKVKAK